MADSILTNYTESGPIVANGTVGTTPTEIIIRSPAEQRVALDVYSTEQVNSIFLPLSGGSLFGDLNMDTYAIHGVHAPVAAGDAANKQYVDVTALAVAGGNSMAAALNMGGNRVVSMADPVAAGDAATRRYVDTSTLALSGLNTMTGPLKMGGNVISSVGAPVFAGDAANKLYVDSTTVALTGDTMNGVLNMNYNPITLVGTPVSAGDATNKYYVDSAVALGVASVSNGVGYLPLTGTSAMVGAFDMGAHAIHNVVTSSSSPATDAANKQYVDSQDASNLAAAKSYTDTKALPITGALAMTGSLNMGAQNITNLATPSAATDAVNKTYVDSQDALKLSLTGGTMSGSLNMGAQNITNLAAPSAATDAANKSYVDSQYALKLSLTGGTLSGALNIGGYRLSSTFTPSTGSDVTNKTYVDQQNALKLSLTGGTMSGALNMGTKLINNLATPLAATDAATKAYVDTTAAGYMPLSGGTLTNAALAGASSTITGTLTCSGAGKITGVPTPSAASDAVPKSYADLLVAGLTFKPAVACYTTLAAPFNTFVYNGGQQITINIVATPIDGYTLQLNDRVLVNCAGTQAANGVYLVTQLASPITLVRPADLDGSPLSEFQQGGLFYVTNGTVFGGSLFVQSSASPSIIGTSPIVYSQYSAAKNIAAGPNIAITGNSVAVAPALSGITGVGLSAGDGSAGVVTVGKASGAASYALALPSAAPASNTFLKYDGANYSWSAAGSPLTGGSNVNITSNAVGLNAAVSGLTSVGINGTSAADALTISKAAGGAAYTLALPAAAPTASTYLKYDGVNYAWASAGSALTAFTGATSGANGTLGGVPAPQAGDQTKYLQGNGTWSAVSATAAVAAQYYYASLTSNPAANTNMVFNTNIVPGGTAITTTNGSSFTLAVGYTYKIFVNVTYNNFSQTNAVTTLTIYNNSTVIATAGDFIYTSGCMAPFVASAFITPTATANITVRVDYAMVMTPGFISIEVVSNNNTITAFTGATSVANGTVGYIPAPQAGTQNSYLRGDGSWQQANNAPTAAQYLMVTNNANVTPPAAGQPMPFADVLATTNSIAQPSPSTFTLSAGITYKCTAFLSLATTNTLPTILYIWYNNTLNVTFGEGGASNLSSAAFGYITPLTNTTISLQITLNSGGTLLGYNVDTTYRRSPWATIEAVSNNNTITAFTGATSVANGTIGYIPAPGMGTQNSYLRGDGNWVQANNAPTAAQYLQVFRDISANVPGNTPVTFPRIIANVGTAIGFSYPFSSFVLTPGYSYKLMCYNNFSGTAASGPYQWYNSTTATLIGITGNLQAAGDFCQGPAIAYISPLVTTSVSVYGCNSGGIIGAISSKCDTIASSGVGQNYFLGFSVTIEVVSNNNTITAFTGATSIADGAIGYIPKPLAGQQNYVLTGSGTWQAMPTGVTGTIFQSVLNTKQLFIPGADWATVPNLAINVTPPSITTKYLLSANLLVGNLTSTIAFRFMRGSTIIGVGSGNTKQGSFRVGNDTTVDHTTNAIGTYLDSPATTSSIIYTLQALAYDSSRGCYFNNLNTGNLNIDDTCCISTLTAQQC